ncbi:MAG TPA: hypothetical protein DEP84_02510 [Chloroflexi bacterium]|nr:hypothetical protein [Chloroflexota bacterium]
MALCRQNLRPRRRLGIFVITFLAAASLALSACAPSPASPAAVPPTQTVASQTVLATPSGATATGTITPEAVKPASATSAPTANNTLEPSRPTASPVPRTPTPLPPTSTPLLAATPITAAVASDSVEIKIVEPPFQPPQSWSFDPITLTVKVGTTITWTNTGAVLHTVTADDGHTFDSQDLQPKALFTFTPTSAGTIPYHCTYHPWMKGTIIVLP